MFITDRVWNSLICVSLKKHLLFSFDVMKIKCMYPFQYVLFSQFFVSIFMVSFDTINVVLPPHCSYFVDFFFLGD